MNHMRKIGSALAGAALLLLPIVVWTQHVAISDWWRLRNYEAPARVVQLADATTMNGYARKVFYVNKPQLEDKISFSQRCQGGEQSIILGCYIEGDGIYIFDVADPRLRGIHEVTAAHEMLHAAYGRLSKGERNYIDEKLQAFFVTITDERLSTTIGNYRAKDPSIVPNELHSILATEVRNLPAEIEEYYRKYFIDRVKIVELSEQYEQTFTDFKRRVSQYDSQLTDLKRRIDANEQELGVITVTLDEERAELDRLLSSGRNEQYNAALPAFNARVRSYNKLLAETRELIDSYNRLVQERNAVALEEQELIQAIDSRIQTQSEE